MRVDISLSTFDACWSDLVRFVESIDRPDRTYGTVWIFDHFSGAVATPPKSSAFECFAVLGALAAKTRHVGLGSLVANVNNRSIGVLATGAATIQTISEGRLHVGIGAGPSPGSPFAREQHMLGLPIAPLRDRHALVVDTISALRALWGAEPMTSGQGAIVLNDPAGFPVASPLPPITVGVNSARFARLVAGAADEINAPVFCPELAEISRICDDAGTPLSTYAFFEPRWLDPSQWEELTSLGIDRLVLVVRPPFADHQSAEDRRSP